MCTYAVISVTVNKTINESMYKKKKRIEIIADLTSASRGPHTPAIPEIILLMVTLTVSFVELLIKCLQIKSGLDRECVKLIGSKDQ